MSWMLAVYGVDLELDVTPNASAHTWKPLCDGLENLDENLNEQIQEYFFLCGKGHGSSEVTGLHPTITLGGRRKVGDDAQDFVVSRRYETMEGRKTFLRYSLPNADGSVTRWTNRVTMQNIKAVGGATTEGSQFSVDLSFNGRPIVETVAASTALTVASVSGGVGLTVLTVTPTFPDAGCKFVYAWDTAAPTATIGSVLTGWNDFTNGATYQIPNGKKVTVAMVNVSTYIVVGNGNATVVSGT